MVLEIFHPLSRVISWVHPYFFTTIIFLSALLMTLMFWLAKFCIASIVATTGSSVLALLAGVLTIVVSMTVWIGFGGYVSFPISFASRFRSKPLLGISYSVIKPHCTGPYFFGLLNRCEKYSFLIPVNCRKVVSLIPPYSGVGFCRRVLRQRPILQKVPVYVQSSVISIFPLNNPHLRNIPPDLRRANVHTRSKQKRSDAVRVQAGFSNPCG